MKEKIIFILLLLTFSIGFSQIKSGEYAMGLNIAYNPENKLVTGYYENFTGFDEETGNPKFSCIFYLHGFYKNGKIIVTSYYPIDKLEDEIKGELQIIDINKIKIKLSEEHGGCWNVEHFANDFVNFDFKTIKNWKEIRYIDCNKAYFYGDKKENTKKKSFLIKGDVVYIDKIENNWIHCQFHGKKITEGWLKQKTVNKD